MNELDRFHLNYMEIFTAAILNNRFDIVLNLLSIIKDKNILNEINSDQQNFFHLIAKFGQQDENFLNKIFNYVDNQHIEWNTPDKYGLYPLHYASIKQNKLLIEYLQKKYSNQLDFNQTDSFDNTAYGLLFCSLVTNKSYDKDFFQKLIISTKSLDCLCNYDNEIVINPLSFGYINSEYLITYPPEQSQYTLNNVRTTPLINAIVHDNYELVKFLLELGVDRNFSDEQQRTPLMHAVRQVK